MNTAEGGCATRFSLAESLIYEQDRQKWSLKKDCWKSKRDVAQAPLPVLAYYPEKNFQLTCKGEKSWEQS